MDPLLTVLGLVVAAHIILALYQIRANNRIAMVEKAMVFQEMNSVKMLHMFVENLGGRVISDGDGYRVVGLPMTAGKICPTDEAPAARPGAGGRA